MNKICLILLVCFSFVLSEQCKFQNVNDAGFKNNLKIPKESCVNYGYICNLSVKMQGEVSFSLGNKGCSALEVTESLPSYVVDEYGLFDKTNPDYSLAITLVEDENVEPIYFSAAYALILNAAKNRDMVSVIYTQLNRRDERSVRLLSVRILN